MGGTRPTHRPALAVAPPSERAARTPAVRQNKPSVQRIATVHIGAVTITGALKRVGGPTQSVTGRNDCTWPSLDVADKIADRLVRTAIWSTDKCTWLVTTSPGECVPASVDLYQGTSGIALFLAEASRVCNVRRYGDCAAAALRFAVAHHRDVAPFNVGFACGRGGIAYALARSAAILAADEWASAARRLLDDMSSGSPSPKLDLTHGLAGSIIALLSSSGYLDMPELVDRATQLGYELIQKAKRKPQGWAWATHSPLRTNDLTGLAHGASGYGAALFELYAVTKDLAFRYAAERAYDYERSHFDNTERNWKDFNPRLLPRDPTPSDIETALSGFPAIAFRSNWCRGAAGIALARLRAYDLTRDQVHAVQARDGCTAVAQSLRELSNYSLCHGRFGNCEILFYAASVLGETTWRETALEWVADAFSEGVSRDWPCGVWENRSDPGLFVGEAGIGHFLLRLADSTIPSVLLPIAGDSDVPGASRVPSASTRASRESSAAELHSDYIKRFFGASLRVLRSVSAENDDIGAVCSPAHLQPDLTVVKDILWNVASKSTSVLFVDALRLETALYNVERDIADYGILWFEEVIRADSRVINWSRVTFSIIPGTVFQLQLFDWRGWVDVEHSWPPRLIEPMPVIVYATSEGSSWIPLSSEEHALLRRIDGACRLDELEIVRRKTARSGMKTLAPEEIVPCLQRAYASGFLRIHRTTTEE